MIDAPPRPHSCSKKSKTLPDGQTSATRGAALMDELHDPDGDGAEQEDVYKTFLAQHEFSHEPRAEERRGEQTDVQVKPNPFAWRSPRTLHRTSLRGRLHRALRQL